MISALFPKATTPIAWEDVGTLVELPSATKHIAEHGQRLRALRPRHFRTPKRFAKRVMRRWATYDRDEMNLEAGNLLGCAVTVLLHEQGWRVDSLPQQPTTLTRDGMSIQPFLVAHTCMNGTADAGAWKQMLDATGVAEADLRALYERTRAKQPKQQISSRWRFWRSRAESDPRCGAGRADP